MSDVALLNACESRLRTVLGDPDGRFVGVQPDGQPPPVAGQKYVAVHEGGYRNTDTNPLSLDERYGVNVTVSFRSPVVPQDRRGTRQRVAGEIRATCRAVVTALHASYVVLNAANDELGALVNGFVEPLRFASASPVKEKGADWFHATGTTDAAYVVTLKFVDARRLQTLESMT